MSTDQAMRLDLRRWFRAGWHRSTAAWWSPVAWNVRGVTSAEIAVVWTPADPEAFKLVYNRAGVDVSERVPIVWSQTGGATSSRRPWVACPRCRRRVGVLWGVDGWWRCRQCHGLRYGSEAEDGYFRAVRRVEEIRRRLGCDLSTESGVAFERGRPARPSRMPKATYGRLLSRLEQAEDRAHRAYVDELRRFVATLSG